jgi:hypothetical protein
MNVETNSKILTTLTREKAFYFFTSIGNYTGMNALSLKEFVEKIGEVNVKSLEFHLCRGDFEKWVSDVLQDNDLASEMRKLQKLNLTGDDLRSQLSLVASRRLRNPTV